MFLTQNHTPKTWQKFNQSLIFQFFLNSISGFLRGGRVSSGDEGIFENILLLLNSPLLQQVGPEMRAKTSLHSFTAAVQRNGAVGNVQCALPLTHVVSFTFLWNYEFVFVFVYFCVIVQQLKDVYMSLYLCNCLFPYTLFPQQLSGMGLS